jgi:hypothetical protein
LSAQRNTVVTATRKRGLAQHFTPTTVAELIWEIARHMAAPPAGCGLRVIDPAAGAGAFLRAMLGSGEIDRDACRGIELDRDLAPSLDPPELAAMMCWGDGLLDAFGDAQSNSFDVVIANPPFGRLGDLHPAARDLSNWASFDIWKGRQPASGHRAGAALAGFPIELLFLERALQLAVPGGVVALVMPEGYLSNSRLQWARDWTQRHATVLAVVALPTSVFRSTGLNARAGVVFMRRHHGDADSVAAQLVPARPDVDLDVWRAEVEAALIPSGHAPRNGGTLRLEAQQLTGRRWDPGYWQGQADIRHMEKGFCRRPLGDYIEHLTYGPIITGQRPQPVDDGIRIILQGDLVDAGVRPDSALRVQAAGPFDPPRSRVRQGDLLLARSGAGALGRNRMAVYVESDRANVGCFVDLVRLCGLNPFYAWLFLKTPDGWGQIQSLINGVGTPNINFSEIRSLRIPQPPMEVQEAVEVRYRSDILPQHRRRTTSTAAAAAADGRFRDLVGELHRCLQGQRVVLAACP